MTIYDLIAQARRENQTPAASRTLDMLVVELGNTRDNLRDAIRNVKRRPLPADGERVLDRLLWRAERERIDDLDYAPAPRDGGAAAVPLDDGTAGIGALLAGIALLALALTLIALFDGFGHIFGWIK